MSLEIQLTIRIPTALADRLERFIHDHPSLSKSSATAQALDMFLPKMAQRRVNRAAPGAGQDEITGRAGRNFGVSAGRALGAELGEILDPVATLVKLRDGRLATIRTARMRNTQWGCLDGVRDRVEVIICAYTKNDRDFQLWEISPKKWSEIARPASSGHKLYGKLTLVSKSKVDLEGTKIGSVSLSEM